MCIFVYEITFAFLMVCFRYSPEFLNFQCDQYTQPRKVLATARRPCHPHFCLRRSCKSVLRGKSLPSAERPCNLLALYRDLTPQAQTTGRPETHKSTTNNPGHLELCTQNRPSRRRQSTREKKSIWIDPISDRGGPPTPSCGRFPPKTTKK